jgi:hypothetical protein
MWPRSRPTGNAKSGQYAFTNTYTRQNSASSVQVNEAAKRLKEIAEEDTRICVSLSRPRKDEKEK